MRGLRTLFDGQFACDDRLQSRGLRVRIRRRRRPRRWLLSVRHAAAVADVSFDEPEFAGLCVSKHSAAWMVADMVGQDVLLEDDIGFREVALDGCGVVVGRGCTRKRSQPGETVWSGCSCTQAGSHDACMKSAMSGAIAQRGNDLWTTVRIS